MSLCCFSSARPLLAMDERAEDRLSGWVVSFVRCLVPTSLWTHPGLMHRAIRLKKLESIVRKLCRWF